MTLIPGFNAREEIKDWNSEFKGLRGELTEEVARKTLGKFLMSHIGILIWNLTGAVIEAYQRLVIKGWLQKNFTLTVAARSFGKSMLFSHFCYVYCLINPDRHVLLVAANFRSSRRMLENIDVWSRRKRKGKIPGGELLRQCFSGDMVKKQDMYKITFKNGSSITAVPLGDPDNLRSFRCNVLGIDEGLLIPQTTIDLVLKPFLAGGVDVTRKLLARQKETRLIEEGRMKEEERQKWKAEAKMIILSSASYKWEELYQTYKTYRAIIEKTDESVKAEETESGEASYLVHQLSYKYIPERVRDTVMEPAVIKEIEEKLIPQAVIDREYGAQFIDESGGFFSAKEMAACTIESGKIPSVELGGEQGAEYILGIDPSIGADPAGDHFAMCVLKIIRRADGRKVGLVVHQYACSGVELKYHIAYLHYILSRFKIVYIACDTTQGEQMDFINVCNESEYFKTHKIAALLPIQAEFTNSNFDEIVKEVGKSYNVDSASRRIVQKQYFSSAVIKAANDHLRACFDQKLIWFPSHAASVPNLMERLCGADVMNMNAVHPEYRDTELEGSGSMYEFVLYQDALIEQTKKECALIEVKSSVLGNITFDLPHHMTTNRKNVNRNRKDSYSALWLAAWGVKIFLASQELPPPEDDTPVPVMTGLPFGH